MIEVKPFLSETYTDEEKVDRLAGYVLNIEPEDADNQELFPIIWTSMMLLAGAPNVY